MVYQELTIKIKSKIKHNTIINERENFINFLLYSYSKYTLTTKEEKYIFKYIKENNKIFTGTSHQYYEIKQKHMCYINNYSIDNYSENVHLNIQLNEKDSYTLNINNPEELIQWYDFHFKNDINLKISNEYNLHQKVDFIRNNLKFEDVMYNEFKDINIIRENFAIIKKELINNIDMYYQNLNNKRENIYKHIKQNVIRHELTENEKINSEIAKQKEIVSLIKEERMEI